MVVGAYVTNDLPHVSCTNTRIQCAYIHRVVYMWDVGGFYVLVLLL
jgi:hypothetical protein